MKTRGMALFSITALLVASAAYAGTATFAGTANDTGAQLAGSWVNYETDGIASALADAETGATTNLTSLCGGAKTLPNMGSFTVILKDHNDFWGAWYGAWLEPTFSAGPDAKLGFGFGPEWDWFDGSCPVYIWFGDQTEATRPTWRVAALGAMPIGIRLSSNGTNLTLSWSADGTTFTDLQSWPINNLPGGLGDMTSQALSLEINEYCTAPTICKVVWTADSVPSLNGAGGTCAFTEEAQEGEAEGEGEEQSETCAADNFATLVGYWTSAAMELTDDADNNWNGIPDKWEFALLGKAICDHPEIQDLFDANKAIATAEYTRIAWENEGQDGVAASYVTMSMDSGEGLGCVWWFLYLFNDVWQAETPEGWAAYTGAAKTADELLSAAGDYDGDGVSNLREYYYVVASGGTMDDYVNEASNSDCKAAKYHMLLSYWGEAEMDLTGDADNNWNGIPDKCELALLGTAMCEHPEVEFIFLANKAIAAAEYTRIGWDNNGRDGVAAAYATMSMDSGEGLGAVWWFLYLFNDSWQMETPAGWTAYTGILKTESELLSAAGDYDGDSYSNLAEYQDLGSPTPEEYAYAASGGFAGPSLPIAGLVGLGLLAGAVIVGGAASLRRKK